MEHLRRYSSLVFLLMVAKILHCQKPQPVLWDKGCPEEVRVCIEYGEPVFDPDTLSACLFYKGFPFAVIEKKDSLREGDLRMIDCGPQIHHVKIEWAPDLPDSEFPFLAGGSTVPWTDILENRRILMDELADAGYPYARLYTLPRRLRGDTLVLEYALDRMRLIPVRKINIAGELEIHPRLFQTIIGIRPGDRFSPDKVRRSKDMIRQWNFAGVKEIRYGFDPLGVDIEYEMLPMQASRFDLLIALLPSSRPDRQYELTGNAFIDVHNQLKMAERLYMKFDKYGSRSQALDLQVDFPYLPLARMGILGEGSLDRRDTVLMDVSGKMGVQFSGGNRDRYVFFLEGGQSRLIGPNLAQIQSSGRLPENLDFNYTGAGLSFQRKKLDDRNNPRKGYGMEVELKGGVRNMVRNARIMALLPDPPEALPFSVQYDGLEKMVGRFHLAVLGDQFIPLGTYSVLRIRGVGKWIETTGEMLDNEKWRPGGFRDFRGFPEKSFLADRFAMGSMEYRFLFAAESNVYVFTDFGILHNNSFADRIDYPVSAGIGLNLGTKAGIFGISYAVGSRKGLPFSLKQGQVNFGLVVDY